VDEVVAVTYQCQPRHPPRRNSPGGARQHSASPFSALATADPFDGGLANTDGPGGDNALHVYRSLAAQLTTPVQRLAHIEDALRLNPEEPELHYHAAVALSSSRARDDLEAAKAYLTEALRLNPLAGQCVLCRASNALWGVVAELTLWRVHQLLRPAGPR